MRLSAVLSVTLLMSIANPSFADCSAGGGKAEATTECVTQTDAATTSDGGLDELPVEALSEVDELRVQMRYFMAVGMQKKSAEKRDAIAAIYAEHGVMLPQEYQQ